MRLPTPAPWFAVLLYLLIVHSGKVLADSDRKIRSCELTSALVTELSEELRRSNFALSAQFVKDRQKRFEEAIALANFEQAEVVSKKLDALTTVLKALPPQLQKSRSQAINAASMFIYHGDTPSVPHSNDRVHAAKVLSTFPGMLDAAEKVVLVIDELRKLRADSQYSDLHIAAHNCMLARSAYQLAWQLTGDLKKADEVSRTWQYKSRPYEGDPLWNPPAD